MVGCQLSTRTGSFSIRVFQSRRTGSGGARGPLERSNCGADEWTSTHPSLQPRNEQVVKYGEQRQEGVRSMPKEADPQSKTPARGQAFENLSRWRRVQAQVVHQDRPCNTRKRPVQMIETLSSEKTNRHDERHEECHGVVYCESVQGVDRHATSRWKAGRRSRAMRGTSA